MLLGMFGVFQVNGQKIPKNHVIGVEQHYGSILNIHPFFPGFKSAVNTEVSLGLKTNGGKLWHQFYGYPEFGLSLSQAFLGNQDTLGNATAGLAYFGFSKRKNKLFFETKIGGGFAYFNKPFDAQDNPGNLVVGSPFTGVLKIGLSLGMSIGENWECRLGGSFWHHSNSHLRVPNIGANLVYGSLVVKYYLHKVDNLPEKEFEMPARKWRYNLMYGLGLHETEGTVYPYDGPLYSAHQLTFYMSRRVSYKGKIDFGLNYNYYNSFYDQIVSQELYEDKFKARSSKLVLIAGYEFLAGHLGFQLHAGYNLYYPIKDKLIDLGQHTDSFMHKNFTHNVAINYYLKRIESLKLNPFVGFGLKSIGGKADFLDFRIGIGF